MEKGHPGFSFWFGVMETGANQQGLFGHCLVKAAEGDCLLPRWLL
jgi:hypothetical protein